MKSIVTTACGFLAVASLALATPVRAGSITHTHVTGGSSVRFWENGTRWMEGQRGGSQLDIYAPENVPVNINGSFNGRDFGGSFNVGQLGDPAVNHSWFHERYGENAEFGAEGTSWSDFTETGIRLSPVQP